MKKLLLSTFVIFVLFGLLTGCAFTDDKLKLRYDAPAQMSKVQSIPDISIAKWTDSRKVDDPKFVYYKNNNYGKTMGRLSSEDLTVVDFTTDVVRKALQEAGIKIVDNSQFVLSGRILSLDSTARVGFFSVAVDSVIHGEVQLSKGEQVLNKSSFVEKGTSEEVSVVTISDYEDSLKKMFGSFSTTIINFIKASLDQK